MILLNGLEVKNKIEENLKNYFDKIDRQKSIAILENTFDKSAQSYSKSRKKIFEKYEIPIKLIPIDKEYNQEKIIKIIKDLNQDNSIAGIFLEMPLAEGIDSKKVIDYIEYEKDLEGVTTKALGKLFTGDETISPPTAMSVIRILEYYNIPISGANVVIINRSLVIGKPLIALLLNRNATVTVCHTKTRDLASHIENADIVVSGVAKSHFFKDKRLKKNAVIIDASINFEDGKMVGDFDPYLFTNREDLSYTPVPGGVGTVTNSILLENCIKLLSK